MNNFKKNIYRTSTGGITYYTHIVGSTGNSVGGISCGLSNIGLNLYSLDSELIIGSIVYSETTIPTLFNGGNLFFPSDNGYSYRINTIGVIIAIFTCTGGSLYSYKRDGSQQPGVPEFHIPYVIYIDTDGFEQTEYLSIDTDDCSEIYALSIVETRYAFTC